MKRLFAVALCSAMLLLAASAFAQTASFGPMMGSFGSGAGSNSTLPNVSSSQTGFGMMAPGSGFGSSAMPGFATSTGTAGQTAMPGFADMTTWMESILASF